MFPIIFWRYTYQIDSIALDQVIKLMWEYDNDKIIAFLQWFKKEKIIHSSIWNVPSFYKD